MKKEIATYVELPDLRVYNPGIIPREYLQIKQDVQDSTEMVYERLLMDPAKAHFVI